MAIKYVIKRDGSFVDFSVEKVANAIYRAARETNEFGLSESGFLANIVVEKIAKKYIKNHPDIESIQDTVEEVLIEKNYITTAKAYILYREQHARMRNAKSAVIDAISTVDQYVDQIDWRVKANANLDYSLGGLILNLSGKVVANYWLNRVYTPKIAEAHRNGFIHIHDLDMLSGYCAGWS
jgi:ribonucleoside-triphosphate reductase